MDKDTYRIHCHGILDCVWLSGFLTLFQNHEVNIRKLQVVPDFSEQRINDRSFRMEVVFEVPPDQSTLFFDGVSTYFDIHGNIPLFSAMTAR